MSKNRRLNEIIALLVVVVIYQWVQNAWIIHWVKEDPRGNSGPAEVVVSESTTKPTIIYHPGPPKMGTTSLQCALAQYQSFLVQDGYAFAGKIPTKFCPSEGSRMVKDLDCLVNLTCQHAIRKAHQLGRVHPFWTTLKHKIDANYPKANNIIFSDETHSMFHEKEAYDTLPHLLFSELFSNWTKHLVVGYRWYWEFWLSSRREYNRLFTSGRRQMQSWDGRNLQSMVAMLRDEIPTPSYLTPHTQSTLSLYGRYFDKITILNLHEHDDMVKHFLCDILVAPTSCNEYLLRPTTFRFNPSSHAAVAADVDRLVMASRRWINTSAYSRWDVVNTTLTLVPHHVIPNTKMMLECPTTHELQRLLQKSLDAENHLFSHAGSEDHRRRKEEHVQQFWKTNFCALNVAALLQNDDYWRIFFQRHFA
jgi:hypothetical protein